MKTLTERERLVAVAEALARTINACRANGIDRGAEEAAELVLALLRKAAELGGGR